MSLGARTSRIVALVTGETLRLAIAGVLAGSAAGWLLSRVLQHLLYGVTAPYPLAHLLSATGFAALALAAAAIPARSAARVQPAMTLRQE